MALTSILRLAVLGVLACACTSSSTARGTKEQREVQAYRKKLAELSVFERESVEALGAVMGDKYQSDAALLTVLVGRALPQYRRYLEGLRAIQPENPDLLEWHRKLQGLAEREGALLERLERALDLRAGTSVLFLNQEQRRVRLEMDALLADFDALTVRQRPAVAAQGTTP
jgi:hypothetical protein